MKFKTSKMLCLKTFTLFIFIVILSFPVFLLNNDITSEQAKKNSIDSAKIKHSGSGKLVKLMMVDWEAQGLTVDQQFNDSREYNRTPDPAERLEEGEEFTPISIELNVRAEFTFKFKLTNRSDEPISNSIVWMHIGFMPKTKEKFYDTSYNELYEALGTGPSGSQGPGMGANRMFGRPLTYSASVGGSYGPYFWKYNLTDNNGIASFKVNFNHSYLSDFAKCFGTVSGINSLEDTLLYLRVICANFSWSNFTISNPNQYHCSSSENVFNGSDIINDYDFTELENQDPTYMEGLIQLRKGKTKLILNKRLNVDFPNSDSDCEAIYVYFDIFRDDMASYSILDSKYWDGYSYYAFFDIYNPAGIFVIGGGQNIFRVSEGGGCIVFSENNFRNMYEELGPGVSTIQMYITESDNYRPTPTFNIPFELNTNYNTTYNRKRSYSIDLINPFITAWGTCYENGEDMPFESNYPYLIGTFWFEPDFIGTKERSFQDYIKVYLICTIYNDDGSTNEFVMKECLMLRPGNYDGIVNLVAAFGPEDAFLMDKNCSFRLIFNADYNGVRILEEDRELVLYLLDLKIVRNPSSLSESVIWSIYEDQFTSSNIDINIETNTISAETGALTIGDDVNQYGIEVSYHYIDTETIYSLKANDNLLSLTALSSLEPIAVIGNNGTIDNYQFKKDIDWKLYDSPTTLQEYSIINFTGETPEDNTDFKVIYKFNFDFATQYYGKISYNGPFSNNILYSWIDLKVPPGYLNTSYNTLAPMNIRYNEELSAGSQIYQLSYGLDGVSSWDNNFIIYNEHELNSFSKSVSAEGFPKLTFSAVQTNDFNVTYGIKAQYDLGYGFQKKGKWHSDSIRTIYNNITNNYPILNSSQVQINTSLINNPSLLIGLDNSDFETTLKLNNVPIYYDPALNFTFLLDPIIIDQIKEYGDFNTLRISLKVESVYTTFNFSDYLEIDLDYNTLKNDLELDGSYKINYDINIYSAFQSIDSDYFNINISLSQVGLNNNYIPYVILETFRYEHNSFFIITHDRMPQLPSSELDVKIIIKRINHIQLFSIPFRDNPDYPAFPPSPFDLPNNSNVTVVIEGMPNATLVSLYIPAYNDYNYNYFGKNITLIANDTYFNMITNLALFLDIFYINDPINQSGFVSLYNGTTAIESNRIDRKHFYVYIYEWGEPPAPFLDPILDCFSSNWNFTFRRDYMDLYRDAILWPSDYILNIKDIFTEISNQRAAFLDYNEPTDIVAPISSVIYPINGSSYELTSPDFLLTVIQNNLKELWYGVNDLSYNNTCGTSGTINQTTWDSLGFGKQIIRFYAIDNMSIVTYYEIIIYKNPPYVPPTSSGGGGGNGGSGSDDSEVGTVIILSIIGVASVASVITLISIIHFKKASTKKAREKLKNLLQNG